MHINSRYWYFNPDRMVGICLNSTFCKASHKKKKLAIIPQNFLDFSIAGMVPCDQNIHKIVKCMAIGYARDIPDKFINSSKVNQIQMWTVLQIAVCVVFLLLAAFFAGKKLGQRKFIKLNDEMQALELSFKHLVDDIEMVANHNLKALDGQSSMLKELLTVADKKCLYANDLLKEIDEGVDSLRKRNLNPANALTSIDQGHDKRFRKEVKDTFEELLKKLVSLNTRVGELEANAPALDPEELRDLVNKELTRHLKALDADFDRNEKPAQSMPARPANIKELKPASIDGTVRFPSAVKKTDLVIESNLPRPALAYPVNEVLKLFSEGVTLPQIARTLNMGKGEIELILKIYGEGITMRNVI